MTNSYAPERVEQRHERVTIALPGEMRAALTQAATKHERSVSGELRVAIRRHLELDNDDEEVAR